MKRRRPPEIQLHGAWQRAARRVKREDSDGNAMSHNGLVIGLPVPVVGHAKQYTLHRYMNSLATHKLSLLRRGPGHCAQQQRSARGRMQVALRPFSFNSTP